MKAILLGVDVGYTGCKAVAFDETGAILASAYREYPLLHPAPGIAELDTERVWNDVSSSIKEVTSNLPGEVAALSVSAMGEAFTPVDRNWAPLSNSLTTFDSRGESEIKDLVERVGEKQIFQLTGQTPNFSHPLPKICWLKKHCPDVFSKTAKFLCYGELVQSRLGVEPTIDHSMAARSMAFDIHTKSWSETMLEAAGIDADLLPSVAPAGTVIGHPAPDVAAGLGLSKSTLVVVGGHDQPCGAVGASVTQEGQATYALGTVHVVCAVLDSFKPALGEAGFSCYPHVVPGRFVTMAYNFTGGCLLKWFRDTFGQMELAESSSTGQSVYDLLLNDLPGDPTSLFFMPHFSGTGTPWFDTAVKGSLLGLDLSTKRAEIVKAIIEGTTYELGMNIRLLERGGAHIRELHAIGGGAKSLTDLQVRANIVNRPLMAMQTSEAPALGAAILAGVGAGIYESAEVSKELVKVRDSAVPNNSVAEQYQERLDAYESIYPHVRALYHKLSEWRNK